MNDRLVMLHKYQFSEDAWFTLSLEFGFNDEDTVAYIHVIEDDN